jgi:NADH dehydrogenase
LKRVVVVGAGFGGLEVATHLRGVPVEVTVVDRNNFHTFQPLLYQVATAGLNAADVAPAVRGLFHRQANVAFRRGSATGVDWENRRLFLAEQDPLPFDHLVVGAGSVTNFFGVPGAAEHAFPLYTLADATRLRNHVLERFEAAESHPDLVADGALTFVIVGGGPTGVETAGALAELIHAVLRKDFRGTLDVARAQVVVVEMEPALLGAFHPASQRHALDTLRSRRVEVRLGARVSAVEPTRITLAGGEIISAHTLIWAAGVQANPLAGALGVAQGRGGRIVVDADLSIPGHPEAYAIGDIAHVAAGDGALPQLAPVAMQAGRHVAAQIKADLEGGRSKPFRYVDKGTMATIGRRAAVAELPHGLRLSGTPAWFAWLGLHLLYVAGNRNRLSVLLNWGWSYLTWDRGPRLILRSEEP